MRIKVRRDAIRSLSSVIFAICLTACGGGGSSATSDTTTVPPAPPQPTTAYTGSKSQGVVGTTTALGFQQDLYAALAFVMVNGFGLNSANGPGPITYNAALPGSISGMESVIGGLDADGTGWRQQTYSNYADSSQPGIVLDGVFIHYQTAYSNNIFGFSHYKVTVGGVTTEYNGTLAGSIADYTVNLSIGSGSQQLLLSNFAVTTTGKTANDVSLSGKMYDSALGYVTVSTPAALDTVLAVKNALQNTFYLQGVGGDVALAGSGGATLHIQPLNYNLNYLGLDTDGDSVIDMGARLDLLTGALDAVQPTGTTVLAVARQATAVQPSGSVTLDARLSYTPGGFVSYDWQLLAAPLGSSVRVSGSGATAQFTPDVLGDYLVQLTATAGGKSAMAVLAVTNESASLTGATPVDLGQPDYISAHVGESVTLDARGSGFSGYDTLYLFKPDGSMTAIHDQAPFITSFTPTAPGIYFVILGGSASGLPLQIFPEGATIIAVDEPVRFAPPALVYHDDKTILSGLNAGIFSGNVPGPAFTSLSTIGGFNTIQWWGANANGLFGAGSSITLGAGETQGLLAADLNGDGVADFVTPTDSTVSGCPLDIRESGPGGYSLSSVTVFSGCDNQDGILFMRDGTLGGHKAVVAATFYYGSSHIPAFAAFVEDGSGVMQAPVITAMNGGSSFNGTIHDFRLADVDGDNEPDLVANVSYKSGATPVTVVQVYHGNGNGSFTYLASYTPVDSGALGAPLVIGDFNGDGKMDIAVVENKTLNLFYGDGLGNFPTTPDTRTLNCAASYLDDLDLNHDGHLDLVVSEDGCANISTSFSLLGLFLSDASGTLGSEQHYPLFDANPNIIPPLFFNAGVQGDFNGDGLPDLMLAIDSFPSLVYLPQLPAVTSATVMALDRRAEQVSQPKPAETARHEWLKVVARTRIPPTGH